MKQLDIKFLSRLLMIVSALCMSFFKANAQSTVYNFLTPDFQFTSQTVFDKMDNPTDSTVYFYTIKGYPFGKEAYYWDTYSEEPILSTTTKIISDTGNDFTVELSTYGDDGVEEITQMAYNCNDIGEVQKMEYTSMLQAPGSGSTTTVQYWHTGTQLDSTLSITTVDANGLTSPITSNIKTIYETYDADGRVTLEEMYFSSYMGSVSLGSETRSVIISSYFKSASGKLERAEVETDQYTNGVLDEVTKDITYFDAKERPVKTEEYDGIVMSGSLSGFPPEYSSYEIYHYDTGTGIVNPGMPVQPVIVNVMDGNLSVNSPKAEKIEIYSESGMQVFASAKPAGEIQISLNHLPKGIYLVKGNSGWVKKIVR